MNALWTQEFILASLHKSECTLFIEQLAQIVFLTEKQSHKVSSQGTSHPKLLQCLIIEFKGSSATSDEKVVRINL